MKKIKIGGIPFKVVEVDTIDEEEEGITQGQIIYSQAKILLKKSLPKKLKKSVLYHEMVHGILVELGYSELSGDETFVQALSQELLRMFKLKKGARK